MQPAAPIIGSTNKAARSPRASALRAASRSLKGSASVSAVACGFRPSASGSPNGACTAVFSDSRPPCQPPSILATRARPVNARASGRAYMLASVPELV